MLKRIIVSLIFMSLIVASISLINVNSQSNPNLGITLNRSNDDQRVINIQVKNGGSIEYYIIYRYHGVNFSNLGFTTTSPELQNLYGIYIEFPSPIDEYYYLAVAYFGDVRSDTNYNTYAEALKNAITSNLGLPTIQESNLVVYLNTTDIGPTTIFQWTIDYSSSINELKSKLYVFANNLLVDQFHKYINASIDEVMNFQIFIEYDSTLGSFRLTYLGTYESLPLFRGNGTHMFSLKTITGFNSIVYGIDYIVIIICPSTIDATSYQGPVNYTLIDYQLLVMVSSGDTARDISFEFSYDFGEPTTGDQNGNNETGNGTDSGNSGEYDTGGTSNNILDSLLQNSGFIYIITGVIAIGIIGALIGAIRKK